MHRLASFAVLTVLLVMVSISASAYQLAELFSKSVPSMCWGLSVTDSGVVATIERSGTDTVLATYSHAGATIKRWTPPSNAQFEACTSDGKLVMVWYRDSLSVFGDSGREQLWGKRTDELWPTTISLDVTSDRVVFADQPLESRSTVWCFNTDGDIRWSRSLQSLCVVSAIAEDGSVTIGGEKYGLMYDKGVHAVYQYSPSGNLEWRYDTSSSVIDVDVSSDLGVVVAGLDNGDLIVLGMSGNLLWSKTEAGGWVDLARTAGIVVAAWSSGGVAAYDLEGAAIWTARDGGIWGDRNGLCVDDRGTVIAAIGFPMIYSGNVVKVFDSSGDLLWEDSDDNTVPCVAVSPNGRYVAVSFSRQLRLFEVIDHAGDNDEAPVKEEDTSVEREEDPDPLGGSIGETVEAWVAAKDFVRESLVSPSTAKFHGVARNPYVVYLGEARYRVTASVDSQNRFGVLIRTDFQLVVRAKRDERQTWILESIDFTER
jgi:hypothetical protein